METNGQITNTPGNTGHSAIGPAFCGNGTNLNATPLERPIPEHLREDFVRKRSPSIFRCFRRLNFRKSKSCSQMLQQPQRGTSPVTSPSGEEGICTIDSANVSPSLSNLSKRDPISDEPLLHAPNLRNVRHLMSCAQFSRCRNSVSTIVSKSQMREILQSNAIMDSHQRCHDPTDVECQAMPVNTEDVADLNRTAPVIHDEITLTMDESKRELRALQEFLSSRHFRTLKVKDRIKKEEIETGEETAVPASDSVYDGDCDLIKASETFCRLSMERPSADVCKAQSFIIFSELFQSLGRAIDVLEKEEVWKVEEIKDACKTEFISLEIATAKMEIEQANCLRTQLVRTRERIRPRLAIASSLPKFDRKRSPTVSPIRTETPCTSPNSLSLRSPPNSPNQNHGSPGSKTLQTTPRRCIPTAGAEELFSEHLYTNDDSRPTLDPQRPTLESTPRRPFGSRSLSTNPSLDVIPVGVHNSNNETTCYINAGLQLLSSVPKILHRVEEGIQFWNLEGNPDLEACVAYIEFMEARRREVSKQNLNLTNPIKNAPVADMMFKIYPDKFRPNEEEDCMEFVTYLLLKIHEELGDVHSPSVLFTGAQRRFRTRAAVHINVQSPGRPITKRRVGECTLASRETGRELDGTDPSNSPPAVEEEFNVVPLHFTSRHRTIEDAFHSYTTEEPSSDGEILHWCKFEVLPLLLLVLVQSYDDSKPIPQKALREVSVDEILLFRPEWMYQAPKPKEINVPLDDSFGILISDDLEKDSASTQNIATPPRFLLRAVVFHDGRRTTKGHYTAAVFLPDRYGRRVWYYCDDQFVRRYTRKELNHRAKISQVTLLLYERDCSNFV